MPTQYDLCCISKDIGPSVISFICLVFECIYISGTMFHNPGTLCIDYSSDVGPIPLVSLLFHNPDLGQFACSSRLIS